MSGQRKINSVIVVLRLLAYAGIFCSIGCQSRACDINDIAERFSNKFSTFNITSLIKVENHRDTLYIDIVYQSGYFLQEEGARWLIDYLVIENRECLKNFEAISIYVSHTDVKDKRTYSYVPKMIDNKYKEFADNALFYKMLEKTFIMTEGKDELKFVSMFTGLQEADDIDLWVYPDHLWSFMRKFASIDCNNPDLKNKFYPFLEAVRDLAGPQYFNTNQKYVTELLNMKRQSCK